MNTRRRPEVNSEVSTGIVKAVWLSYWPTALASPAISWNVDVMMKSAVYAVRPAAAAEASVAVNAHDLL